VVIERAPLEDELGDVLEKALRRERLSEHELADRAQIEPARIRDVIDYRGALTAEELSRIAAVVRLNPVGLAAVAGGAYPLPEVRGLPFCLYPLRVPYGIGVANAYIVADCASDAGLLFDTGTDPEALRRVWPMRIRRLKAVFLTHFEAEHVGGLSEVRRRFPDVPIFGPAGAPADGAGWVEVQDSATLTFGRFEVRVLQTPGHAEGHHCYLVRTLNAPARAPLLVSGDLLFAGSIGGAYFCGDRLTRSLQRVFKEVPLDAVVAPGHGPLTTLKNEKTFNPFVV
jgi:hydroxyacylglutathione hydrolase